MRLQSLRQAMLVGLLCWGIVTLLQQLSGSFQSELNWSVDEPAHYISGLMATEYLRQGMPGNPMRFAEEYYTHYPKVAIGSWPPVFYLLQAVWGLMFGSSKVSIFLLVGLLLAIVSAAIFYVSQPICGSLPALALALAYILAPISRWIAATVMAEPLIAVGTLAAALFFAAFLANPIALRGFGYGLCVALTILTKGIGAALVLIPPIAIALTRRWRLLVSPGLWLAAAVVILFGGIWTFFTLRIVSEGWMHEPGLAYIVYAAIEGPRLIWSNQGAVGVCLSLAGAWRVFCQPTPLGIAMISGILSIVSFLTVPSIGLEPRYLHPVLPMMLILSSSGIAWISEHWPVRHMRTFLAASVLVISLGSDIPMSKKSKKIHYGFDRVASYLLTQPKGCVVLVSSQIDAEGMLIAEMAFQEYRPSQYLLRSSKLLAQSNWGGTNYRSRYTDAKQVREALEQSPVNLLVTDTLQSDLLLIRPDPTLVQQVLAQFPNDWERVFSVPSPVDNTSPKGELQVYRHRRKPCIPFPRIEVDMGSKMNRSFVNETQ